MEEVASDAGSDSAGFSHRRTEGPGRMGAEQIIPDPAAVSIAAESHSQAVFVEIHDHLSKLTADYHTLQPSAKPVMQRAPAATPQPSISSVQGAPPPRIQEFGDLAEYWKHFDDAAKQERDGMIKGMKDNLDNILIFAALFSAVNAGFFALTVPMLSNDPFAKTNALLILLIQQVDNSTLIPKDLAPPPFSPSRTDMIVNQLFSASLTLSLLAAFGALLAQQWVVHYARGTPGASDGGRWERERRYAGAQRWTLQEVVELLFPILLQAALFAFIVGFIIFLHNLSTPVALPSLVLAVLGASEFVLSSLCACWDLFCPYHTPLTTFVLLTSRCCVDPVINRLIHACYACVRGLLRRWPGIFSPLGDLDKWSEPDPVAWVARATQRQQETTEVVKTQAVYRFLETTEHSELLKATAVNLPLLSSEVSEAQDPKSVDDRLRKLISLFVVAARRSNQEEKAFYAAAIMHVVLLEKGTGVHTISDDVYISAARAHLNATQSYFPVTTTSIATVLFHYLSHCPDDSTEEGRKCAAFLSQSGTRAQHPSPVTGALLSLMAVIRSTSVPTKYKKDLLDVQRRYPDLNLIRERITEKQRLEKSIVVRLLTQIIWWNSSQVDTQLLKLALSLYDPGDNVSHEITLSLVAWTSAAMDSMDWSELAPTAVRVIEGLENLFIAPALQNQPTDREIAQHNEAERAAVNLVSSIFVDKERVYGSQKSRLSISESATREFGDRILEPLTCWTHYVEAVRKRHPSHTIGGLFTFLVSRLDHLIDGPDLAMFARAVGLLPTGVVDWSGHERAREWVLSTLGTEEQENQMNSYMHGHT